MCLIGSVYHFSGRSIRNYILCVFLGFFTIFLEDLSESESSVSFWDSVPVLWKIYHKAYLSFLMGLCTISLEDLSESIFTISDWDCVPLLWNNYQQVYPQFLIGIVHHFSVSSISKDVFRFL